MTEVKPLTEHDFNEFATVLEEINGQPLGLETAQELRKDFNAGRYAVFLLYEASTPAGIAIIVDTYSAVHAKEILYLDELYIRGPFRRRGFGKILLDHVVEHAKAEGYMRLEWRVERGNTPAETFYSKYETDIDSTYHVMKL